MPTTFTMLGKDYKSFVRRIKGFVSKDQARAILTGVHIFEDGGGLTAEATDSYKLVRFNMDVVAPAEGFNVILPFAFLEASAKTHGANEIVGFQFTRQTLEIVGTNGRTSTSLIEGDYPNVGNIVNQTPDEPVLAPGAFNPKKMKEMSTALLEWDKDSATLQIWQMDGLKPMILKLTGGHSGHAILMPVRL